MGWNRDRRGGVRTLELVIQDYRKFLQKRPLDINAEFAKARMEKLKSVKRRNNYLSLVKITLYQQL